MIKLEVRSRNLRRGLVLFNLLLLILFSLAPFWGVERWLSMTLIGVYILTNVGLGWGVGLIDSRPDATLDERQRAVRDRAHRFAYPVISWYVVLLLLLIGRRPEVFSGVFWGLITGTGLAVLMLPTAIIAWLEPDPVRDEADVLEVGQA